jgi:hypothetical protein
MEVFVLFRVGKGLGVCDAFARLRLLQTERVSEWRL